MNFFRKSILLKLWLVMVFMVLIVLYFTGVVQTSKLKDLYYTQQLRQMTIEAGHVAANHVSQTGTNPHYLAALAEAQSGNIMITDLYGNIIDCVGMGMNIINTDSETISIFNHHDIPYKDIGLDAVLQGKVVNYIGPYQFLDTNVLTVAVPVYKENDVAGMVVFSAPLGPLEERVVELQHITLFAGLVGILLATFLSLFFSRTVSRPLLNMNKSAQAMSTGDYSRRVEVKSGDEIGLLAGSLNSLAAELQKKITVLEQQDQTRREFVANVSHELRTPLSIIQGYTEALIDDMAPSEAEKQKYLANIHEEVLRLSRLVAEILDLRRIESGRVEMQTRDVLLTPIVERVVDRFQTLAGEKKINLSLSAFYGQSLINADPDRLEQVVINLLDNAVRNTSPGGIVEVSIQDTRDKLTVSVRDTGQGISYEELPLIWERFYKVDKSRTRCGGGTGLGLAIVKEIVEAHGGNVEVASKPGEGSTFSFTVPKISNHQVSLT